MQRKYIMHLDADSFFASVEISKNPKLEGKPVVTGQERGIATSMSALAKALGVTRGMPVFKIKKYFPQVVVVHSDYEAYAMYSSRMFAVVRRYAHDVEEYSIDECFADLSLYGKEATLTHKEVLAQIQKEIEVELNISVSLGMASTKTLAKLASKHRKPHGITIISEDERAAYLAVTDIGDVWGVGYRTAPSLRAKGIKNAERFANIPEETLARFAHKPLMETWHELNGRSIFPITTVRSAPPKSIAKTLSFFPFKTAKGELFAELVRNTEDACIKARRHELVAYKAQWFLKTKEYKYISNEIKMEIPTSSPSILLEKIQAQFDAVKIDGLVFKSTGVILSDFRSARHDVQDLFGFADPINHSNKLFEAIDKLGTKYGRHTVSIASGFLAHARDKKIYQESHNKQHIFFDKIKKTGRELCIPYLGEAS